MGHLELTDLHVVVEKDVSELEVSVDDALVVEVFAAQQDLVEEVAALRLGHSFATLVQLHQGTTPAQLKNDVNKILQEIFKINI